MIVPFTYWATGAIVDVSPLTRPEGKTSLMRDTRALRSSGFRAFLATQFLGAFNDNAFKLVIFLMAARVLDDSTNFVTLAGALFSLPFILFSEYAGFLADRFSKKTVMVWAKVAEIAVMLLGGFALWRGDLTAMAVVLFLMGSQSAFFGPSKYGILPEMLPDEDLSRGNGWVQMWTFLAIIAGTAIAGPLYKFFAEQIKLASGLVIGFDGRPYLASVVFVAVAALGTAASLFVTPVPAAKSGKRFELNFLRDVCSTVREVHRSRALFLCMMGSCYFWFIGALFQMNVFLYAQKMMDAGPIRTGLLLTAVAFGIGCGSVLAGRWSGEKVEFGLVPLGAAGLGLFSVILSFCYASYAVTLTALFMLGASAGLYMIPLHAFIQQESPADSKGRVLATTNVLNFVSILLASAALWFLQKMLPLNPALVFLVTGLASFAVIAYIIHLLPDFLLRLLAWLLANALYRIRIEGKQHLPKHGGALLVCNHVSYVDGLLVQSCTQRFIRFIVAREYYHRKWFNPICRLTRAIPIAANDRPKELVKSLHEASTRLREGELVCVFAEGTVTRTGNMLPFNRGLESIMRGVDVPIIPVYLDRLWGSIFSFEGGKILNRLPARLPYPATIAFGAPLPAKSAASEVRTAVAELGAEAFRCRAADQDLLWYRFYAQARRRPFRFCMADSTGIRLTYAKAYIGARALSRAVRRLCGDEEMVGILLPNTVVAALLNVAVTILGKCPVNLNYTASGEALEKALEKCGIRHIFTSRAFLEKIQVPERSDMVYLEDFKHAVQPVDKFLASAGFWLVPQRLRSILGGRRRGNVNSLATVVFSSGSTGDPKGVMLSHANINANIEGLYQILRAEKTDRVLGILPFFHSFGFTGTLWFPLTTGLGAAYHTNPLDFKAIGELAGEYSTTVLTATPTFLMGYIRRCTKEQFASLRYVVTGAEKLKARIAEAFAEKFGIEPLEGYGCTELSPIVAVNMPDFVGPQRHQIGGKPGTIGQPLPGVAVRVVDQETFAPLPPGADGLLLVKGANVMLGYLGEEEMTRAVMHDGWYVTGDLASVDEDGFVTIKDRLSRFSKIAGEMVPHLRLEEEIHRILGAVNEQVCVVTSVPDERKGEALAVLYVGDMDVAAVCDELAATNLPKLWLPRKDAFHSIDEIPLLGSGKLDLKQIKAMAQQ